MLSIKSAQQVLLYFIALAISRLQDLLLLKAEIEHMLQMGIVRPSESPWASPLHMVAKADSGDWRPCHKLWRRPRKASPNQDRQDRVDETTSLL
ncbi:unnamed protein product [Dibothriocephalus latus]|uniref:Reverse transcriptase domain-containing protein n=1 Tax=Dibothriocephalus latus TaxID=60516 RepID=A0A3P6QDP3_DIBLA|nr:unnamed protein product [Dibothriocephalus latus]